MTNTYPPFSNTKLNINYVKQRLMEDDKWLYRGILAIYDRQTDEEQYKGVTKEKNNVGFNAIDAEILTSYALLIKKAGFLTIAQKEIARKLMVKYAGQLHQIALERIRDREE